MYLVETANESFVYRVWNRNFESLKFLESILEVQSQLSKQNLAIVYPVPLPSGGYLQMLNAPEGERAASLFSFASGKPAGRDMTAEQSFAVGQLTANLHLKADSLGPFPNLLSHDTTSLLLEPSRVIQNCRATSKEQMEQLENIIGNLRLHLDELQKPISLFGICHGDIHGMNVLFDDNKLALLDFDWLSYSWRAWDLAVFVWWIRGVKEEAKVKEAFLKGYRSLHPKAESILEAIPIFVPIRHLLLTSAIINYEAQGVDVGRWIDTAFIDKRLSFIQTWMQENHLFS